MVIAWRVGYYSCETIWYPQWPKAALMYFQRSIWDQENSTWSKRRWKSPIMISGITDASGRTLRDRLQRAFLDFGAHVPLLSVGLNWRWRKRAETLFESISPAGTVFVSAYPNAGLQRNLGQSIKGEWNGWPSPRIFWKEAYLNILGGCWYYLPEHNLLLLPNG